MKTKQAAYGKPQRLKYPAAQTQHPWLAYAFEAYYRADVGVAKGIQQQERHGKKLACAKGCAACCKSHTTIPLFPLELLGLYWYVTQVMPPETRTRLKPQLANHSTGEPCPFLLEGACAVHPMRPLACRHFNVFGKTCAEGEDAFYTRRDDVLTPLKTHQDAALQAMLPFHGFTTAVQQAAAMQQSYLQQQARVLQEIDWAHLAARIDS